MRRKVVQVFAFLVPVSIFVKCFVCKKIEDYKRKFYFECIH